MKLLHQLNDREIPLCLLFNRINHWKPVSLFFAAVSRLGDGIFWYVLMLMLPLIYGWPAAQVSLHMGLVALAGLTVYKLLKTSTGRVRPYSHNDDIFQNVAALDQFSFPSGHTLHAVSFSLVLLHYYPEWAVLVIPFATLVALSRVILGLHYPSDVLIGALLGAGLAEGSIYLLPYLP
ncbi:phosphatase PAP2 family protein [Candidatus Thiothrix sp. Deng01]|uniref:undecaprenyl-diphosphate phosphatase n=1 Tax=Candidatus Thiothrix phosphatis TaxID=3112415 RepID=A0ABU6CZE6_9GAMM|nr:phosphatase PAP2 family protein [Candidatus Thiothrix sp. Deng01]MEB4591439.1 phosphatase PAP2 family protein [Candidatus Thiothrix sp. Deng01]